MQDAFGQIGRVILQLQAIFQVIVGCFNTPAQMIQSLEIIHSQVLAEQIRQQNLISSIRKSETNDPQFQFFVQLSEAIGNCTVIAGQFHAPNEFRAAPHQVLWTPQLLADCPQEFSARITSVKEDDAVLQDYVTLYPSVNISGNTNIGHAVEMGTGVQIIQGKTIGDYSIVGAGAVIVRDIPEGCTAVGCPAKPIKYFE